MNIGINILETTFDLIRKLFLEFF